MLVLDKIMLVVHEMIMDKAEMDRESNGFRQTWEIKS